MNGITKTFEALKADENGALIGYVVAGDPKPELTPSIAEALINGGIDVLELGLPFSDPIADGPTIQAASARALAAGTTPKTVLEIAKAIKKKHDVPIAVMTYFNPVFKLGLKTFLALAENCQVDGTIIPDLPLEEADKYRKVAAARNIATIFLAAPSTSNERLAKIVDATSGFLYLVSRFGVTGAKTQVAASTIGLIKRVLPFTNGKVPLAIGFGVSKPEHVKSVIKAGADGVIVGSAFVDLINKNRDDKARMLREIEETARGLKQATK